MKIYIDKGHGLHYHKPDCNLVTAGNADRHMSYESIERIVRRLGMPYHKEYARIKVKGRFYAPCPFCFGYKTRIRSGRC